MEEVRKALWAGEVPVFDDLAIMVEDSFGIPPERTALADKTLDYLRSHRPTLLILNEIIGAGGLVLPHDIDLRNIRDTTFYVTREARKLHPQLPIAVTYIGPTPLDAVFSTFSSGIVKKPYDYIQAGASGVIDRSDYPHDSSLTRHFTSRVRDILDTTRGSSRT